MPALPNSTHCLPRCGQWVAIWRGRARRGTAGQGKPTSLWSNPEGRSLAWLGGAGRGAARRGSARRGMARQGKPTSLWSNSEGRSLAWLGGAGHGSAGLGTAGRGKANPLPFGAIQRAEVWLGRAWRGLARRGLAGRGGANITGGAIPRKLLEKSVNKNKKNEH